MNTDSPRALPPLPDGVEYLGGPHPEERHHDEGGVNMTVLWARYRVHNLNVNIGWIVGHPMGDFREPNQLQITFDASDYAMAGSRESGQSAYVPVHALPGITTSVLRAIPMAHARALMRDRHEQLSVGSLREELSPLPVRVESDRDYVHVAMAYVALVNGSSIEPIKRLAEWSNESVDTWSARLRRSRAKGILLGKGPQSAIAPPYQSLANELWRELRARHKGNHGDQ